MVNQENNLRRCSPNRAKLTSAVGSRGISVSFEVDCVKANGIVYIPVLVVGENGEVEANADRKVKVTVENGELLGFGSANPRSEESFDAGEYTTYYGRALAVVRAGAAGKMTIHANETTYEIEVSE